MPSADQAGTSWIHIILVNSYLRYININQNMYEIMFPTYLAQIQKVAITTIESTYDCSIFQFSKSLHHPPNVFILQERECGHQW
jgi:hypothetical protein